jgi:hypothetical protein
MAYANNSARNISIIPTVEMLMTEEPVNAFSGIAISAHKTA